MDSSALKQLVLDLLSALGVTVENISVSNPPRIVVSVTSPDSKLLIGTHGEHLQSLNTIARRLAEMKYSEEAANFLIDVNGYHEVKLQILRENARLLAQRARLFKHDVELSPMSSYERLVIHELFAEDPEISTESAGEGKMRHIVLKFKENSSQPHL
ncbi:MAG: hypothetical protein KGJ34_01035 [Patescibacteria group bacterium]|nr:hypothetical protein [Patescibacteria group bacterium]